MSSCSSLYENDNGQSYKSQEFAGVSFGIYLICKSARDINSIMYCLDLSGNYGGFVAAKSEPFLDYLNWRNTKLNTNTANELRSFLRRLNKLC